MTCADPLHRLLQPLAGVRWGLLALRRQAEAGLPVAAEIGQLETLVTQALHSLSREFSQPKGIAAHTPPSAEALANTLDEALADAPEPTPAQPACTP